MHLVSTGLAGAAVLAMLATAVSAEPMYRWDWGAESVPPQAYSSPPMRSWDPGPGRAPAAPARLAGRKPDTCWQTSRHIYGKYLVAFCATRDGYGAYSVSGDGYRCQGQSRWSMGASGDRLVYQMARGSCGPTADWTADRIECEMAPGAMAGGTPAAAAGLACTYHPNAPGYDVVRFSAFRR